MVYDKGPTCDVGAITDAAGGILDSRGQGVVDLVFGGGSCALNSWADVVCHVSCGGD